jgi:hypothetical protein
MKTSIPIIIHGEIAQLINTKSGQNNHFALRLVITSKAPMIINCRRFLRNLLISELNYELIQADAGGL